MKHHFSLCKNDVLYSIAIKIDYIYFFPFIFVILARYSASIHHDHVVILGWVCLQFHVRVATNGRMADRGGQHAKTQEATKIVTMIDGRFKTRLAKTCLNS